MSLKPSLVMITSRFPYPLEKGDKLRAFHMLQGLSTRFDITLISLSDEEIAADSLEKIRPYVVGLHPFTLKKHTLIWRLMLNVFFAKPFQVAYFTDPSIKKKVKKILSDVAPNHILCQMIRPAEYVKHYHRCPKTLDYMDALSMGMERRHQRARFPWSIVYRMEKNRLREYELRIFNYFEHHTMISLQDTYYIAHPDRKNIKVIPNGVAHRFYTEIPERSKTSDLVFVGNLSYPPNINAVRFLHDEILTQAPQLSLLVGGANPTNELIQLQKGKRQLTILGWQEDIRSVYQQGRIFIAPMFMGSGLQNKLLEAMALGIPCITTSLANDSLRATHQKEILVGNTAEELLEHISFLLEHPEEAHAIGQNGKAFVRKNYDWEESIAALTRLIDPQPDTI
ncbi:MAG: glycosyltransferase [Flavobacteriales bacterium]